MQRGAVGELNGASRAMHRFRREAIEDSLTVVGRLVGSRGQIPTRTNARDLSTEAWGTGGETGHEAKDRVHQSEYHGHGVLNASSTVRPSHVWKNRKGTASLCDCSVWDNTIADAIGDGAGDEEARPIAHEVDERLG